MSIEWTDQYATGIPLIDAQHQEIFRMVAEFHDAVKAGNGPGQIGRVLRFLSNYTRAHFHDEEAMLRAHDYGFFAQHKAEHDALVGQLNAWLEAGTRGEVAVHLQVAAHLGEWLRKHIVQSDLAYVPSIMREDSAEAA